MPVKIRNNCTIDKILNRYEQGERSEELQYLIEKISDFESTTGKAIKFYLAKYRDEYPGIEDIRHFMIWVENSVPAKYRGYVRNEYLNVPYDVLKKNATRYKTIAEIGIPVEISNNRKNEDYLAQWKDIAEEMLLYPPFFETHAHYNMSHYNKTRPELMKMLQKAGITRCIIPSVEAYKAGKNVNLMVKEMFDTYDWIFYAFASHPKYIWRDTDWNREKWNTLDLLLSDTKCIAVGETGLDYSYKEFCPDHQRIQKQFFIRFIELANKHELPVILHLRPGDYGEGDMFTPDVNKDALEILTDYPVLNGAVLHCFGGDAALMRDYYKCGVKYFGIGGRILNGEDSLESAVKEMPEECILIETDAPYINNVEGISGPNTSLALLAIAEKIAELRRMELKELIEITYHNAESLFGV